MRLFVCPLREIAHLQIFRWPGRPPDPLLIFRVSAGAWNQYADISGWLEPCITVQRMSHDFVRRQSVAENRFQPLGLDHYIKFISQDY